MTRSTTDPLGDRVTLAAAALTPAVARAAVRFQWSRDGLVVVGPHGTEALVTRGRYAGSVPVAPVAALGAFVAAVLAHRPRPGARVVADVDALLGSTPAARGEQWLGFHRVGDGWVSLATAGAAQRELARFGLTDARRRRLGPVGTACRLQSLGLASLPARAGVRPLVGPDAAGAEPGRAAHGDRSRVWSADGWRPLRGCRVLGLGRLVAGPYAANLLAAAGADVTRVRAPGDPVLERADGAGEPIEIDLRTPAGQRRVADLVAGADLLVENFRPRAWQQVLPERLRAVLPRHVAVRGFPAASPCRNWRVLGFMAEGLFGVGLTHADGTGRVPASAVPVWDRVTGAAAAAQAVALLTGARGAAEVSLVGLARSILPRQRAPMGGRR